MKSVYAGLGLVPAVLAASRTTAPEGCITVSTSGGDFSSVQSAVDSLSTSDEGTQCIFVEPGTYSEQVLVPERSAQLSIYGSTEDDTSYAGNGVTITGSLSQEDGLSNDETATLRVKAAGFRLYNVVVENSYGEGSQAVALSAYADSGYYGSSFLGFQDTVLSNEGSHVFLDSTIVGATDFIFGQEAKAWFEGVDIRVVERDVGYITGANGRESEDGDSIYVFNECDIAARDGDSVPDGAYYLGRPWREYAQVVFQYTSMSAVINAEGWRIWNDDDERTCCVLFGEYENTGDGAAGTRADFSETLSAGETIDGILGSGYAGETYFDETYYAGNGAEVGGG